MKEHAGESVKKIKFIHCAIPVFGLLLIVLYGKCIHQYLFQFGDVSLEMLLLLASVVTFCVLKYLGFKWGTIENGIIKKVAQGIPAWLLLMSVGAVVGAWIVSGVVPMLVFYGVKLITPSALYVVAFIACIIFSVLTGTSFGSVGTVGVVLVSMGQAVGANMPILAGAIISGAYFGDKMSPLSDTTNLAAMVAEVNLYDHIRSMAKSTIPATILSIIVFTAAGFFAAPTTTVGGENQIQNLLTSLSECWNFNILLLIPLAIVLVGCFLQLPAIPVMLSGAFSAAILGAFLQNYSVSDILAAMTSGFKFSMCTWISDASVFEPISGLARGGLYSMLETIIVAWLLFVYMGMTEVINALPVVVGRVFSFAKTRFTLVLSTLLSGVFITGATGHIYASIMLPADIFKSKYDELGVPRNILSRSLEDAGTFMDPFFPWTGAGIYMPMITGVAVFDYAPWLILNWSNLICSVILAAVASVRDKQKA